MQVWQLIAELSKYPAGAEVAVQCGPDAIAVDLDEVDDGNLPDYVNLIGIAVTGANQ
jgi:hypothetical protein